MADPQLTYANLEELRMMPQGLYYQVLGDKEVMPFYAHKQPTS